MAVLHSVLAAKDTGARVWHINVLGGNMVWLLAVMGWGGVC